MFWKFGKKSLMFLALILTILLSFSSIISTGGGALLPNSADPGAASVIFFGEAARALTRSADEELYVSYIKLTLDDNTMIVDGKEVPVIPPFKNAGDIVLPIVDIANALGSEVNIDNTTGDITVDNDGGINVFNTPSDVASTPLYDIRDVADAFTLDTFIDGDDIILTRPFQSKMLLLQMLPGTELADTYGSTDYISDGNGQYVLQYDSISGTKDAYDKIKALPDCQNIAPNLIIYANDKTSDVEFTPSTLPNPSWGTEHIRASLMKNYLADNGKTSTNITVAVLDTGADANHPHLVDRMLPGHNYSLTHASDPNWTADGHGHGTHVSGTIVDCTPNNVKIMPVKVLDDNGYGNFTGLAEGIVWATDKGAKVINMSFGGTYYGDNQNWDLVGKQACEYAVSKGVTLVAAAGNDNIDTKYCSPARLDCVITVSATDLNDRKADFSNYGDAIDVAAPGVGIYSSVPGGGYKYYQGTSMASPHVAAAAAMLKLYDPNIDPKGLKIAIRSATVDLGPTGWDRVYGAGVIDFRIFFGIADIPVTQFSIWPNSIYFKDLNDVQNTLMFVDIYPSDATNKSFTVTSTNSAVAVYKDGYVMVSGIGKTIITLKTSNDLSGTCSVIVVSDEISDVKYGDVDGDGMITPYDATLVLQHVVGMIKLEGRALSAADTDHDGSITPYDATMILQYVVGMITSLD